MEKQLLRTTQLNKRNALNFLDVQGKSHEATQRLITLPAYKKAKTVFTYLAYKNELNTNALIQNAWQQGKTIVVPICQKKDKTLLLSRLNSFNDLVVGNYNIFEPKQTHIDPISTDELDLVILPGLAFDLEGNRLGYGGGFIDRFLPTLAPTCTKIALAYDFQILPIIPTQEHDIPVDIIVTDKDIYPVTNR